MAATLSTTPPNIALSKDDIWAVLTTDQVNAVRASILLVVSSTGPTAGQTLEIQWGAKSVTFTIAASPDDSGTQLPTFSSGTLAEYHASLADYFERNDTLLEDFNLSIPTSGGVKLVYKSYDAVDITTVGILTNVVGTVTDSTGPALQSNLSGVLKVFKEVDNEETTEVVTLNGTYDQDGELPFNLADVFDLKPGLPSSASIDYNASYPFGVASEAFIKYYLRYADKYGIPATAEGLLKSSEYYAIYGGSPGDSDETLFGFTLGQYVLHSYRTSGTEYRKPISPYQPDWVYVFTKNVLTDYKVKAVAYYDDGTQADVAVSLTPFTLDQYKVYWFPSGPLQMGLISEVATPTDKELVAYDWILISDDESSLVNPTVQYAIDCDCHPWNLYLLFANGLGGCESINLRGKSILNYQANRSNFQTLRGQGFSDEDGEFSHFNQSGQQTWRCNTGYYEKEYIEHLRQLLMAEAWIVDRAKDKFVRVNIDTNSFKIREDDQDLFFLEFDMSMASLDRSYHDY